MQGPLVRDCQGARLHMGVRESGKLSLRWQPRQVAHHSWQRHVIAAEGPDSAIDSYVRRSGCNVRRLSLQVQPEYDPLLSASEQLPMPPDTVVVTLVKVNVQPTRIPSRAVP